MEDRKAWTGEEILAVPMAQNDANAATIRGYLVALARAIWNEGAGFSGKRPFGNSGWSYDIATALYKAGAVAGETEQWGDGPEDVDFDIDLDEVNAAMTLAFSALSKE